MAKKGIFLIIIFLFIIILSCSFHDNKNEIIPGDVTRSVVIIDGKAEESDYMGFSTASGDFDGDGYQDCAIGTPWDNIDSVASAGAVNIIYGSEDGLTAAGNQLWHQDVSGIEDLCEPGDCFGYALASGDFNGDSYDDIAIGVPFEDVDTFGNAGVVNIIYGSKNGLTTQDNQIWSQDRLGIEGECGFGDNFGKSLASGDFNGDDYDDIAIGVPDDTVGTITHAGAVNIIYGSKNGLTAEDNQLWHQDSDNIIDVSEHLDLFGSSLASGDFDGDHYDDIAIGVQDEDIGTKQNTGAVNIIYGTMNGLTDSGNQFWHQDTERIAGTCESWDRFGSSLASGDFNTDHFDDIAIGVPFDNVGLVTSAGAVNVIYGSSYGIQRSGNQLWHQDKSGIEEDCETDDRFGSSLASGDFDEDGCDDIAIGVYTESVGTITDAGAVNIIFGTTSGLSASGDQLWHQDINGTEGKSESGDSFGRSLASGDYNDDGADDITIGVQCEDTDIDSSIEDTGCAHVLYGLHGVGLSYLNNDVFFQEY